MNNDLTPTAWKLILVGVAAGLVGGGLGIGGGIILIPLLLAIGLDRHRSHATSLAAIVLIAAAGAWSWGAEGQIDVVLGVVIGLGGVVGSVLGASLMHRMSSRALSVVFGVVLLIAGIRMITGANPLPGVGDLSNVSEVLIAIGIGLAAGFFAGVAGVGGGVIIVPASVLFLGLPQHEAQGTSLLAIILTASAATVVNLRNQRVRLKDGLVVGIGGVVGSVVGSRLALRIDDRTLSLIFGFLVLFVALRTLYRAGRVSTQSA
jgi:uncharacterized membrane protein YfcA